MKYKDLFSVHQSYIKHLMSKSYILHQNLKNISESGGIIESEISNLIEQLIPPRFKVTNGYIVSTPDKSIEPIISPQIDLMIVDTLVTNSIFSLGKKDGLEVIPIESVAAIFEIKKTLETQLDDALKHIGKISINLNIKKDSQKRFLPGGIEVSSGLTGGCCSNILLGVLSASVHQNIIPDNLTKENISSILDKIKKSNQEINIVGSLSGTFFSLADSSLNMHLGNPWPQNPEWVVNNQNWCYEETFARIIGYINGYLNAFNAKPVNVEAYFFNSYLK